MIKKRIHISSDDEHGVNFGEIVEYRELLFAFVKRDVLVRYKQTVLGFLWAIIQPLVIMLLFTVIFGHALNIDTDGVPYSLFFYAALLPWNLFSEGVTRSTTSMVSNFGLISKIYFPRILLPIAGIVAPLVDFVFAFGILIILTLYHGRWFSINIIALPFLLFLVLALAGGIGLWMSALNTKYRDIQHGIPFGLQVLFFMSPIIYSSKMISEPWNVLWAMNPIGMVISGSRWAMFNATPPTPLMIVGSIVVTVALFVSGLWYFEKTNKEFADVI
jgi:lipopolysaccharide transport system permease protein